MTNILGTLQSRIEVDKLSFIFQFWSVTYFLYKKCFHILKHCLQGKVECEKDNLYVLQNLNYCH